MPQRLVPIRLPVPGSWGLNTQRKADLLPAQWATVATNCIFDDSGRLACRKGTQAVNASAIAASPAVRACYEYIDSTGSAVTILASGNKIYRVNGTSLVDITGTITTPTADNWKFTNFNGKCIGVQAGHPMIVLSSVAGSFADVSTSGTYTPTTAVNEVLAAFGRIWVLDGTDLKYSALLDETNWATGAGAGVFDLSTVWIGGMDVGIALAEFNGYLVIFGQNSIVVYSNPWVPTGGGDADTSTMELVENIGGVGCIARDTVAQVGKDLVFLSYQGVRYFSRTIQEKSMPLQLISENVNDELMRKVLSESADNIKAVFSPSERAYLLTLPVNDETYYFDLRLPLQDGSYRATTWNRSFNSMMVNQNQYLYFGGSGYLYRYYGYFDDADSTGANGVSFEMDYMSGWTDLSEAGDIGSLTKLPKNCDFLILGGSGQVAIIKWAFDFQDTFSSFTKSLPASSGAEWGEAEWGPQYVTGSEDPDTLANDEWSGGLIFNRVKAPMKRTGQALKVGFSTTIEGDQVALQLFDMLLKIGRMTV